MTHHISEAFVCNITGRRTKPVDHGFEEGGDEPRLPKRWARITVQWVDEGPPEEIEEAAVDQMVALARAAEPDKNYTPIELAQLKTATRRALEGQMEPDYTVEEIEAHLAPEAFVYLALLGLEDELPDWVAEDPRVEAALGVLDGQGPEPTPEPPAEGEGEGDDDAEE